MAFYGNTVARKKLFDDFDFSPYDEHNQKPLNIEEVFAGLKASADRKPEEKNG